MKIKIVKSIQGPKGLFIKAGKMFQARKLMEVPFQFQPPYQIIDGEFSGIKVPYESAIETEDEITYTQKEWNDMENHYMHELDKEQEQKERAQHLVTNLKAIMKRKNIEIEELEFDKFIYSSALKAAIEKIDQDNLNQKNK